MRLGRRAGYGGHLRAPDPALGSEPLDDVGLRDDRARVLILVECWNTFGDLGAAVRSTSRKRAEAAELAIAVGGDRPHRVFSCWVVRDVERNRQLVARYPELFASTFPGLVRPVGQGSRPSRSQFGSFGPTRPPSSASSGATPARRGSSPGAGAAEAP